MARPQKKTLWSRADRRREYEMVMLPSSPPPDFPRNVPPPPLNNPLPPPKHPPLPLPSHLWAPRRGHRRRRLRIPKKLGQIRRRATRHRHRLPRLKLFHRDAGTTCTRTRTPSLHRGCSVRRLLLLPHVDLNRDIPPPATPSRLALHRGRTPAKHPPHGTPRTGTRPS